MNIFPFPQPLSLWQPPFSPRFVQVQHCLSFPFLIPSTGPTTSCEIDGETVETVSHFIFLGSKITADRDCSHEIKVLTPWKKSYDQPRQHIQKQRHYFANKVLSSQTYGFPVVMNGCESCMDVRVGL